jgi:hypothetical protein
LRRDDGWACDSLERSEAIQGISNCGLVRIASLPLAMTGRLDSLYLLRGPERSSPIAARICAGRLSSYADSTPGVHST